MGWQDRDYAKETVYRGGGGFGFGGRLLGSRSVSILLIWINAAVYIVCALTAGPRAPISASPLFQYGAMESSLVLNGQVWRLFTSDYLHWSFGHIFMNMLGLYFLGPAIERVWGSRKFFAVYAAAGILGSLFYLILSRLEWVHSGVAAGASGCVLGLLGVAAVLFPKAEVYIYFLFPVKIRVVAVVFAVAYTLNIWQNGVNAGGDACHLAGLGFGVWYALQGDRWWELKGRRLLSAPFRGRSSSKPGPPLGFRERMRQRKDDARNVDQLLAKVRSEGITSLTESERRILHQATERQRADEEHIERGHLG